MTRGIAPAIRTSWMAAVPTPLDPAWISTESPARTFPVTESTGTIHFTLQLLQIFYVGIFYRDHLAWGPPNANSLAFLREHIDSSFFLFFGLTASGQSGKQLFETVISRRTCNLCFTYEINTQL